MKGETRRPLLHSTTPAHVGVGRAGQAQILAVNGPIGIEHLGEPERDLLSAPPADFQPADARNVLSEIKYILTGFGLGDFARPQSLRDTHSLVDLRGELAAVGGKNIGRTPTLGRGTRLAPVAEFLPRVVTFAVVDVGKQHRPVAHLPSASRRDAHLAAVPQFDVEAREKLRMRPVVIALVFPEKRAGIPAITKDRSERVAAGLEHLGYISGHHLNPLAEVRPSGHEKFAADFLAVEK